MNGMAADMFMPTQNVSREMTVMVLSRLDGVESLGGDDWYVTGRALALEHGISDGTMMDSNVTREQFATMLYRYANYKGLHTTAAGDLSVYTDNDEISDWAGYALVWACGSGIMNGRGDGTIDPSGYATRAEMAAMITRFCELYAE